MSLGPVGSQGFVEHCTIVIHVFQAYKTMGIFGDVKAKKHISNYSWLWKFAVVAQWRSGAVAQGLGNASESRIDVWLDQYISFIKNYSLQELSVMLKSGNLHTQYWQHVS